MTAEQRTLLTSQRLENGQSPRPRRPKRGGAGKWIVFLLFLALAGGGSAVGYALYARSQTVDESKLAMTNEVTKGTLVVSVVEDGNLESASNVDLKCRVEGGGGGGGQGGGTMILWIVPDGTEVKKDQLLVTLDSASIDESIDQQKMTISDADAALIAAEKDWSAAGIAVEEYKEGTYKQTLEQMEADITQAKQNLSSAENTLAFTKKMHRQGYATSLELESKQSLVLQAKLNLGVAMTKKTVLVEYTSKKTLEELASKRDSFEAKLTAQKINHELQVKKLQRLERNKAACTITAPQDGTVVDANDAGSGRGGQQLVTHVDGGTMITIVEPSRRNLKIAAERIRLSLGASAEIKLAGDQLQASFPPDTMAEASCKGNVRFEWGETTLAAETIELNLCQERLVASGHVRVVHRDTRIEADKVQFNFADGRFEIQGAGVVGDTMVDKLPAATWGDVRNGWQLGLRWKSGRVEHTVGEEAWYEVVARNPGRNAVTVPVTKGEHSDVTLYAGNKIQIRIHGGERENVVLLSGEERVLDVWRSRLSTDGLAEGEYMVGIRSADDDVPQPTPLGLRLTPPDKRVVPRAPRDLKGSAVADTGEPEADPETIVWGEPVLGLQAGVRFVTSLSRRKPRNLIEAQVFVCNTTEREVEIEYLHHTPLDFAPVVRDGDGRELEALLILTGPKFNETRGLPPGRPVLVGTAQFEFRSRDGGGPSSPTIIGPPGKYHYSTWLHIGGTNLAYVGIRLTTGELPLEFAENAVEADGAAAPNADETGGVSGEGAVDIKTPFDGRMPANRRILVEIGGGSAASEAAVEKALDWIRRHQNRDGSWSIHAYDRQCKDQTCTGQGASHSDVAATAMGLLPLLGAGWTHQSQEGPYAKAIDNGLKYLIANQAANGNLAGGAYTMYSHGLATIALSEAYGMTKDPSLGKAAEAAVRFIEAAQHPTTGGWRYSPGEEGDTSVVSWQVTGLKSAQMAGIEVKDATFDGARKFLTSASAGEAKGLFSYTPGATPTPTMTASGLLCTQHLGIPRDSPRMKEGVDMLMRHLPAPEQRSVYYWHYANQVMHNLPGPQWDEWNGKLRAALIESQVANNGDCAAGSWDPQKPFPDPWGTAGGRLMTTSLSCLALEVYYRYLPHYRAEGGDGK
jgi:hypothetical protein